MRRNSLLFAALIVPTTRPSIEMKGFHMVESQVEKRLMELEAKRARVYKPENVTALDDLQALIWGTSRKPFKISGQVGVLDSESQDFQIHTASEVVSPDGYYFKTDNISYQSAAHTLTTDDSVEGRPVKQAPHSYLRVFGKGLLINLHKDTYEIRRNVRAEEKVSDDNTLQIRSSNAIIYPDLHSAVFTHNVTVKSPQMEVEGGRLAIKFSTAAEDEENSVAHPEQLVLDSPKSSSASKKVQAVVKNLHLESHGLVVDLNTDGSLKKSEAIGDADGVTDDGVKLKAESLTQEVIDNQSRVLLKGNVTIITKERLARCEEAEFFPDTGQIVLKRIASVKNGDQLIEGELIRFSTKGSEIVVEKAKGLMNKQTLRQGQQ